MVTPASAAVPAAALAGTGQGIHGGDRLVHDRAHLVVIPSVGVVISDDHSGVRPILLLLQEVDHGGHECLLVQRIRVARVAILITGRLEEADGGKVAGVDRVVEVMHVVLMIRRVSVNANGARRSGPGVLQVLGRVV